MSQFLFCEALPAAGEELHLSTAESRHLATVLRARAGDEVGLLNGTGQRARAVVLPATGRRGRVSCRVLAVEQMSPPRLRIWLYVAPPRAKGMHQVVRQATELGVRRIVPILTERSVARPAAGSTAAWTAQAVEACKQSGNPFLPEIAEATSLADAIAARPPPGYFGSVPDSGGTDACAGASRVTGKTSEQDVAALWVGPEGGFTAAETAAIAGVARPLTIGPWVLRIETAVVAGISYLYRDLPL